VGTPAAAIERPSRLPEWSRPLVRAITGRDDLPNAVTGPATRRALRSVRTPGATVGRTIALAEAPSGSPRSLGVLAHELSHVADRPETPRLFGESLLDAGERRARRTGASVASFASRSASEALGAVPVSSLPVAGAAGMAGAAVRSVRDAVPRAAGEAGGLAARGSAAVSGAARALGGRLEEGISAIPSAGSRGSPAPPAMAGTAGRLAGAGATSPVAPEATSR